MAHDFLMVLQDKKTSVLFRHLVPLQNTSGGDSGSTTFLKICDIVTQAFTQTIATCNKQMSCDFEYHVNLIRL